MERLIGLGAGGHAKVVIEAIQLAGGYELAGLLDADPTLLGGTVLGIAVLGNDTMLPELHHQGLRHIFIGLGGASDTGPRRRLYQKAIEQGFEVISAVHPKAIISPSASTGPGLQAMAGSIVNAGAALGENVLVNTGAIVEHECVIGSHVHIATGARLASTVRVGNGAHVGAGATIRQAINVGAGSVVGAGAVVVDDVPPWTVVAGVPARPLRTIQPATADTDYVEAGT